MTTSSYRMER